jgi:hypothetical protein
MGHQIIAVYLYRLASLIIILAYPSATRRNVHSVLDRRVLALELRLGQVVNVNCTL